MDKSPSAAKWTDRSSLNNREAIETRIRELTSSFAAGDRSEGIVTEVEVLVAAAFVDPIASTRRGDMPLSRALTAFANSTAADFKKFFSVRDYGSSFEAAYDLAIDVVGANVALALMEDVLTITGDHVEASMLAIQRMVCPTSRFRPFAAAATPVPSRHAEPALA